MTGCGRATSGGRKPGGDRVQHPVDEAAALTEIRRVLKAGGELRFLEHVRSRRPTRARIQVLFDRTGIQPLIGGGCHCSRRTTTTIAGAGFELAELEEMNFGPSWFITNPHVLGRAFAPGAAGRNAVPRVRPDARG